MIPTPIVIDRVTRVTPLGVRFWDGVTGKLISDGLLVTAYHVSRPDRRVTAIVNHAHTFVLQNMPGLRDIEFGEGDAAYWSLTPTRPFVIEVIDTLDRFQPFTFAADLPQRDVFKWLCASPVEAAVPLFSAPARSVPGGQAVIRLELRDAVSQQPAAWALIDARYNGQSIGRSYADRLGRLALIVPYPEPPDPPITSPPSTRTPLVAQTWSIELRAFHTPIAADPPDLCDVLQQSAAQLFTSLSPPGVLTQVTLTFGQELVVKSLPESIVWITP